MTQLSARPILEVRNVHFRRNGTEILSAVNWTVSPGQHWALLGANGSGKTTLLKLITGYEWASEGSIEVLGKRFGACNIPQLRRTIGWVSTALQERLPGHDTALRIVASGYDASLGVYRGLATDELDRAKEALDLVGSAALASRTYAVLSQGERQRVLIARALVNRPKLLVLDEPCVGLDPRAADLFLEDLGRLVEEAQAPSIVLVTHHIEEITPWIDSVLILKGGRVSFQGPTAQTLSDTALGEAFDCRCHVEFDGAQYRLRIEPTAPASVTTKGTVR